MRKLVMKVMISLFAFVCLCVHPVYAASASASLSGPKTVRANDTITLNFNVSGKDVYGVSGSLSFDSSKVTLVSTKKQIGSSWAVEFNGNTFVAYDNNLTAPINSTKTIFSATFKVNNLSEGESVSISIKGITATDGQSDIGVGSVSYSKTIAAPLSSDNTLSSLVVSNATISPAFSSSVTSYSASVPYEIDKLSIKATANDSKASVSISNNKLVDNATTNVVVTVKAENGSKKTYTIAVKRAADPNYVPSSNNKLSSLNVEGYLLSPVFSVDLSEYIVWLPYETESINVSGITEDKRASLRVEGNDTLEAGKDNEVKVIVTAENGEEKTYTIIAKRGPAHEVENPDIEEPTVDVGQQDTSSSDMMNYVLVFVAGLMVGVACDRFLVKKAKKE